MLKLKCLLLMCFQTSIVKVKNTAVIRKVKKLDKDLKELKRTLAQKEPIASQNLYLEYHHRDVYNKIDTDLEAFFYKRQYSIQNFNFLINLLGVQKKSNKIPDVLNKMNLLNINCDQKTYNYLIKAAAHQGNVQQAEKHFQVACQKFRPSKYLYTTLMQAYVETNSPSMAFNILQEMKEKHIQPDLPTYTTLINCFRIGRSLEKCWEINKMLIKEQLELDETYVGVMLKVYAATHDSEKAIKLYKENIIDKNIKPMIETTNSYFKALSCRPEYSKQVIDSFFNLYEKGTIINLETIQWAIKATATTANIKSASEIIKIMQDKGLQPNKNIYNNLLRCYGKACDLPHILDDIRQLIVMDSWKLLEEIIQKGLLDTSILNSMLYIHANAMKEDKIEGLILPMFQKYKFQYDTYTFQVLAGLQYKKGDFKTALRLWEQMNIQLEKNKEAFILKYGKHQTEMDSMKEQFRPTFNLLEMRIQIGIRLMDMHIVLEALELFKKLDRTPKNSTLKFLGNLPNLPVEIQTSLMDFKIRFGAAKLSKKGKTNGERQVDDPQNK